MVTFILALLVEVYTVDPSATDKVYVTSVPPPGPPPVPPLAPLR